MMKKLGNLKESFFSGLQTAGRNIGIMDTLGTKPQDNFNKIKKAIRVVFFSCFKGVLQYHHRDIPLCGNIISGPC